MRNIIDLRWRNQPIEFVEAVYEGIKAELRDTDDKENAELSRIADHLELVIQHTRGNALPLDLKEPTRAKSALPS